MKIGIVGKGVVGSACGNGFTLLGHNVIYHDPKLNTCIDDLIETDIIFICVPTPEDHSGQCDTSLVYQSVGLLKKIKYPGIIAIKSTVAPGTTQELIDQYSDKNICYVPEFIREHNAHEDFIKNHMVLAVGCASDSAWHKVCDSHGWLPKNCVRMSPSEAEILKYFSNTFNALRVVFANAMYSICENYNSNYDHVLNTYLLRQTASPDYLKCSPDLRGYGGPCLPKDTKAMAAVCKKLNLPFNIFDAVNSDNAKLRTTVFPGMRK
jgi:UDPglucose 6-dehydrogenase